MPNAKRSGYSRTVFLRGVYVTIEAVNCGPISLAKNRVKANVRAFFLPAAFGKFNFKMIQRCGYCELRPWNVFNLLKHKAHKLTRNYCRLCDNERRKLEQWRVAKISIDVITEKLGRHRSTIFRELKRNRFQDIIVPHITGYFFMVAKMKSATRRAKDCKLSRSTLKFSFWIVKNNDSRTRSIMDSLIGDQTCSKSQRPSFVYRAKL